MMECSEVRQQLEEYRRGELGVAAAAAVEAHLATCAACRRLHDENVALAAVVRGLGRTPAPSGLRRRVAALPEGRRRWRAWLARPWVASALSAAAVALVLLPWVRFGERRPSDPLEALLQSGVAEHRRILLQLEAGPGAVDDPAALFERVRSVTEVQLPTVFAGVGDLRLLTARPTVLVNRKSAAAALRYPASPVVTCFVLPGKDLPPPPERGRVQIERYRPYQGRVDEFNVIYWKTGDLAYLMVSGLDIPRTQQLYLQVRKAL
jgi:Putative zinc-finger